MVQKESLEYFRTRAMVESTAARHAGHPAARAAHNTLAELYLARTGDSSGNKVMLTKPHIPRVRDNIPANQ